MASFYFVLNVILIWCYACVCQNDLCSIDLSKKTMKASMDTPGNGATFKCEIYLDYEVNGCNVSSGCDKDGSYVCRGKHVYFQSYPQSLAVCDLAWN